MSQWKRTKCPKQYQLIHSYVTQLILIPPYPPQGEGVEHNEDSEDSFDSFWKIYPRKESKQNARKAWDKLKPSPALAEKSSREC